MEPIDMVPAAIRRLPVDPRLNLPIPWFVYKPRGWQEGQPVDFRIADASKRPVAFRKRLCWVCGGELGTHRAAVFGPMCLVTGITAEPLMHIACARYSAAQVCPFLTRPQMKRSPRDMPADAKIDGIAILRNPGVVCLGVTKKQLTPFRDRDGGLLFELPRIWDDLKFYREGRAATFAEIMLSVTTGLPALKQVAQLEGPSAEEALQKETARAIRDICVWTQSEETPA